MLEHEIKPITRVTLPDGKVIELKQGTIYDTDAGYQGKAIAKFKEKLRKIGRERFTNLIDKIKNS